jgi:endonuclease/exonuclease/phosphatase (EEP) superfamily protein YafD
MASSFFSLKINPWHSLTFFMMLGCIAQLGSYLGAFWWPFENLASFRLQYFLFMGLGALIFFLGRKRNCAVVLATFALVNWIPLLPLYFGPVIPRTPPTLRVMSVNVHTGNKQFEKVLAAVRELKPDIAVFLEVDGKWAAQLKQLEADYPYSKRDPRSDNFGLVFYSRIKPGVFSLRYYGTADVPTVHAEYKINGRVFTLLGTHPVPPISGEYAAHRNAQLESLANVARQSSGAVMLIGDLNVSSDTPTFRRLLDSSGLRDGRLGFGMKATWPVGLRPMYITIDHCLVSKQIHIHDYKIGPDVGSDHYPVIVDISLD